MKHEILTKKKDIEKYSIAAGDIRKFDLRTNVGEDVFEKHWHQYRCTQ